MNTSHSSPKSWQARASADPHCPAPVSVALPIPARCWGNKACATAVFGLWDPAGETPSYL